MITAPAKQPKGGLIPASVLEAAETWSRRIALHIARGEFDVAHNVIEMAEREWHESHRKKTREELLALPLVETKLPLFVINRLEEDGIFTVGDALARTPEQLMSVPQIREKSLQKLLRELESLGFRRNENASGEEASHGQHK